MLVSILYTGSIFVLSIYQYINLSPLIHINIYIYIRLLSIYSYSDIPCVKIDGVVRGYGPIYQGKPDEDAANHQWVAVCIDDQWRLLDPTWGTGYVSRETGQFVADQTMRYAFVSPRAFMRDHWPMLSQWNLCDRQMSLMQFKELPQYGHAFDLYGFSLNLYNGTIRVPFNETCSLNFGCDSEHLLLKESYVQTMVRQIKSGLIVKCMKSSWPTGVRNNSVCVKVALPFWRNLSQMYTSAASPEK